MKNSVINFLLFALVSNLFFAGSAIAQISRGGTPPSEIYSDLENINNLPVIIMEEFDIDKLIEEDKLPENGINKPLRFAKAFDVNINVKEKGLLEILPNNDKLWRLRIKSPGAYSLNLTFGEYVLPVGAKIFISNKSKTHTIGAFTEENNKQSKILAIQPVEGDEIIIEYSEPSEITNPGKLIISRVGHDYKGILKELNTYDAYFGLSQWCNVDINCPAGDDWQTEKWSVCRIIVNNIILGSGSLINNTSNNYLPFFLTANHLIYNQARANNTVFYFNYESPSCNGPDGSVSQTISGSSLMAHWSTSDFSLVQLSSTPPISYYPVWNGWDRRTITPSAPVACIHHPAGDVRKISTDNTSPSSYDHFWVVYDWNIGTVEGGSSGAPFYNSDHRVVGQVSGGNEIYCSPNEISYYGKFSSSWNGGGSSTSRLRNWLDPNNTGVAVLNAIRIQYITGPSIVCTSNSTFTLHDRPSGTTVNWTKSSNLSYVSGQSTDNYTVKATPSAAGPGWVQATISGDCGDVTIRYNIDWVGKPSPSIIGLSELECGFPVWYFINSESIHWGDFYWSTDYMLRIIGTTTGHKAKIEGLEEGYGQIFCEVTNTCGSAENRLVVWIECWGFKMSPNPADDYFELIIEKDETKLTESKYPDLYEVSIYNSTKVLVYQKTTKEPTLRINTRNLVNGTYYVNITLGEKTKVKQLIVSH